MRCWPLEFEMDHHWLEAKALISPPDKARTGFWISTTGCTPVLLRQLSYGFESEQSSARQKMTIILTFVMSSSSLCN
ncbi:hypothetical protein NC653_035214 [Populus alba x Populus x berolinensis]|uniref:Uncharacterized protein n=1 Tax=Populus alba x Populus x berolinensis TaxID=444605 RepID=A0AAD6LPZ3_9ROSI|nr:hypothetical protein NC653_035214 [Populus alba x Populus x berolinensis]